MTTGAKIWGPTPSQTAYDFYGNPITPYVVGQCAYGNLYSMGYGGILYCYDDQTGKLLWTYGNGGAGNSTSTVTTLLSATTRHSYKPSATMSYTWFPGAHC